jgi:glycosyltransferase involved in cell wall biosynthesis
MKLTLIITTYNWPESLLLVIESIRRQSTLPDEIIVADDGSNNKTKDLITNINKEFSMNIIHSWQKNNGFRAARSRNKAILKSSGDYLVLIDGDIILHPNFVKDHLDCAEPGYFIQGTRVLITKKGTIKILDGIKVSFSFFSWELKNRKNAINSKYLSLIFSGKKNNLQGIKSCNLAFYKKDCLNVNGFNNDFEGWGREDSEFVVRLINSGIKRKNVRFNANQFHLWHNENSRKTLDNNNKILNNAINNNKKWCKNGINSLVNNES